MAKHKMSKDNELTLDELRTAPRAEPFRPFTIMTADHREFHISYPRSIAVNPDARQTFVIAQPPEDSTFLDRSTVTGLRFDSPKPQKHGTNGKHKAE